jgi:hypothetical protein
MTAELATMAPNKDPKVHEGVTKDNAALWVTYANIILYALCYQLQRPVEPFLVQQLSKNAGDADSITQTYGRLQAFFSMIQAVGSPLVGILLDFWLRRHPTRFYLWLPT